MNTKNLRLDIHNGETYFSMNTDLLIAKKVDGKDKAMEVLAVSLYGIKSTLNRLIKKNRSAAGNLIGNDYYKGVKFELNKFSNYEKKEVAGKYHQRVTLVRRKDLMIDQTKQSNPIVMLRKADSMNLQNVIFEYVRDNIVSPLFPDVRVPQILAGELFITIEKAEVILENVNKGIVQTEEEKRTYGLLQMYYQWVDYLVQELAKRNRLQHLEVIVCPEEIIAYELIILEDEIREIVSRGLRSKAIKISSATANIEKRFSKFDAYMPVYSATFKKRIESIAEAEHNYGDLREETEEKLVHLGNSPISVQIDAIEAGLKSLKKQKRVNIVGEPGVGKTFMMSSIAFLDSLYSKKPMKLLVFSPDHLVESAWQRETEETLIESTYHHINSVSDLIRYEKEGLLTDDEHRVFILAQNAAKNGYANRPMVRWETKLFPMEFRKNRYTAQKVFVCPSCGDVITKRIKNPSEEYNAPKFIDVPVGLDFYATERFNNRKCNSCNEILWGASNKNRISYAEFVSKMPREDKMIYTSSGFIPNDTKSLEKLINEHSQKQVEKPTKARAAKLKELRVSLSQLNGEGKIKNQISPYKVPVADYIFKKCNGKFTHLIIDEAHEVQNAASSRTEAAGKLIASVEKVITGTGTMMNGYARSLFFTFFMLFPKKMKSAGFEVTDTEKFQVSFGVTEKRFRLKEDNKRMALAPKSKPGISPIIFPMFLQDTSVFINLDDLKTSLPSLETKPVEVDLSEELKNGKSELESAVARATKGDIKMFKSMMPTLYSYLDMPTVPKDIKDADGNVIYTTKSISNDEDHKIEQLKRIIKDEVVQKGNRVIVYTYYTNDGINDYIKAKVEQEGYRVTVLNKNTEDSISCDGSTKKVPKNKREAYIKEEVKKGTDVLICNPELVKTGTNLIDFAPIVRYQMDYQVYTERQARGRTRRIGQVKDCTIYYLYYKNSFQEEITKLMATKIVASEAIEGKMDASGLDAITNSRTPEEELAKKFFEHMGI